MAGLIFQIGLRLAALLVLWLMIFLIGCGCILFLPLQMELASGHRVGLGMLKNKIDWDGTAVVKEGDADEFEMITFELTAESLMRLVSTSRGSNRFDVMEFEFFHDYESREEGFEMRRAKIDLASMEIEIKGEASSLSPDSFRTFFAEHETELSVEVADKIYALLMDARRLNLRGPNHQRSPLQPPLDGRMIHSSSGVFFGVPELIWLVIWAALGLCYLRRAIAEGRAAELAR